MRLEDAANLIKSAQRSIFALFLVFPCVSIDICLTLISDLVEELNRCKRTHLFAGWVLCSDPAHWAADRCQCTWGKLGEQRSEAKQVVARSAQGCVTPWSSSREVGVSLSFTLLYEDGFLNWDPKLSCQKVGCPLSHLRFKQLHKSTVLFASASASLSCSLLFWTWF